MPLVKCNNCGAMMSNKVLTCPKCGNPIKSPSAPYFEPNQPSQIPYNSPQFPNNPPQYPIQPQYYDNPSTGLNIISFLIPLVGWIMYFSKREHTPNKAKACAKWAWIGFGISCLLEILILS